MREEKMKGKVEKISSKKGHVLFGRLEDDHADYVIGDKTLFDLN